MGEVARKASRTSRQITVTSNRKMLALRRQMTSSKCWHQRPSQSPANGFSSPKGRAKASYIGTRNGAYLELPLNARAARKSDGRKTVSVPAPLPLPVGEVASSSEDGRQITSINRKMLAPSQADDVPRGARPSQSPAVTALPKGEPRHRILAQEMERICIDTLHSCFTATPQCACRPKVGWS